MGGTKNFIWILPIMNVNENIEKMLVFGRKTVSRK